MIYDHNRGRGIRVQITHNDIIVYDVYYYDVTRWPYDLPSRCDRIRGNKYLFCVQWV